MNPTLLLIAIGSISITALALIMFRIRAHRLRVRRHPALRVKERLPSEREGYEHRFIIGGQKCYLTVGEYDGERLAEIFLTLEKNGGEERGFGHMFSIAVSIALQHGVAFEHLYSKFAFQDFEPNGMTNQREIPKAKSIVDYVFQYLNNRYDAHGFRREKRLKSAWERNEYGNLQKVTEKTKDLIRKAGLLVKG